MEIPEAWIAEDGGLYSLGAYLAWPAAGCLDEITLDGRFTVEELEAIVKYIREYRAPIEDN